MATPNPDFKRCLERGGLTSMPAARATTGNVDVDGRSSWPFVNRPLGQGEPIVRQSPNRKAFQRRARVRGRDYEGLDGSSQVAQLPMSARELRTARGSASERQELDPVDDVFRFTRLGDDLQVVDTGSHRNTQLVPIDHTVERDGPAQTPRGLTEKIIILGEEHTLELMGSVQSCRIGEFAGAVFVGRDHVYATQAKPVDDGFGDMLVHVERQRHPISPSALSLVTKGDSPNRRRVCSTDSRRRRMSWSSSSR